MSFKQLEEVIQHGLVPQDLLVEAGMSRLASFECPSKLDSVTNKRYPPLSL